MRGSLEGSDDRLWAPFESVRNANHRRIYLDAGHGPEHGLSDASETESRSKVDRGALFSREDAKRVFCFDMHHATQLREPSQMKDDGRAAVLAENEATVALPFRISSWTFS